MQTRRLVTWLIGFLSWNVLTKDSEMIKLIKECKGERKLVCDPLKLMHVSCILRKENFKTRQDE